MKNYFQTMAISPDASFVATSNNNLVEVFDVSSGEQLFELSDLGYLQSLAFSPDESSLIVPKNGRIQMVDMKTGEFRDKEDSKLIGKTGRMLVVNLSRNIMALSQSSKIAVFDLDEERLVGSIPMPSGAYPQTIFCSDDGAFLAVSAWKNSKNVLVIIDIEKQKVIKTFTVPSQNISSVRFATGGESIFVSGYGIVGVKEIRIDSTDEELAESNKFPSGTSTTSAIHPDNESFVTISTGGQMTWFEVESGRVLRSREGSVVRSIDFTEDASELLIVGQWGNGKELSRANYRSGKTKRSYSVSRKKSGGIVFSTIIKYLDGAAGDRGNEHTQAYPLDASFSSDFSEINVFMMEMHYYTDIGSTEFKQEYGMVAAKLDAESGKLIASKRIPSNKLGFSKLQWIQSGAIHPEGQMFAVAPKNQVLLVESESADTIATFDIEGFQTKVEFSPDGSFLAGTNQSGVWVWDVNSNEELLHIESRGQKISAFSRNGNRFAVGGQSKDSPLEVYSTENWKPVVSRESSKIDRRSVSLSQDGNQMLVGLADCRVELWDLVQVKK